MLDIIKIIWYNEYIEHLKVNINSSTHTPIYKQEFKFVVYGCEVYDTPKTLILSNIKKCKDLKLILDFINGL